MRDAWILVITCDRDSRVVKCKSYEAAYDYMKAELKAEVMAYGYLDDEEFDLLVNSGAADDWGIGPRYAWSSVGENYDWTIVNLKDCELIG